MQENEMLRSTIEQIEKEIWHLVKKTLPELKEEIMANIGGGKIGEKIDELVAKMKTAQENIVTAFEKISTLEKSVEANTTTINNHSQEIQNLSSALSTAQTDIESLTTLVDSARASLAAHSQNISSLITKQSELEESINSLSSTLDSTRASLTAISQTVSSHTEKITAVENSVSSLSTTLDSTRASMTAIGSKVNTISDSVDNLSTKVSSLETSVNAVKDIPSEFSTVKSSVSSMETSVDSLKASLTAISQRVTNNTNSIKDFQDQSSKISELQTAVSNLTKAVNNLTNYDLLYDMNSSDANINHGLTSGLGGTDTIAFNFDDYKYLRVFAVVNGVEGLIDMPLANRVKTDYTIVTANMLCSAFAVFKVSVVPATSKVQPTYTGIYTYNTTNGSFTQTYRGIDKTKSYIHRIEAYRS